VRTNDWYLRHIGKRFLSGHCKGNAREQIGVFNFDKNQYFFHRVPCEKRRNNKVNSVMDDKRCKVLVGVTGSVATIRLPALVRALITRFNAHVRVVATQSSLHFFTRSELPEGVEVFVDADEYSMWRKKGDPVLHIEV